MIVKASVSSIYYASLTLRRPYEMGNYNRFNSQ